MASLNICWVKWNAFEKCSHKRYACSTRYSRVFPTKGTYSLLCVTKQRDDKAKCKLTRQRYILITRLHFSFDLTHTFGPTNLHIFLSNASSLRDHEFLRTIDTLLKFALPNKHLDRLRYVCARVRTNHWYHRHVYANFNLVAASARKPIASTRTSETTARSLIRQCSVTRYMAYFSASIA